MISNEGLGFHKKITNKVKEPSYSDMLEIVREDTNNKRFMGGKEHAQLKPEVGVGD